MSHSDAGGEQYHWRNGESDDCVGATSMDAFENLTGRWTASGTFRVFIADNDATCPSPPGTSSERRAAFEVPRSHHQRPRAVAPLQPVLLVHKHSLSAGSSFSPMYHFAAERTDHGHFHPQATAVTRVLRPTESAIASDFRTPLAPPSTLPLRAPDAGKTIDVKHRVLSSSTSQRHLGNPIEDFLAAGHYSALPEFAKR
jgi:hypothetical protein